MSPKSSKAKAVPTKVAAPKKQKAVRKKSAPSPALDADKFLIDDGIKFPAPAQEVYPKREVDEVGIDPETALVSDVMTRQTLYCYADQSALEVRDIFRLHGVKQLPVVDTSMRIIGIVYGDAIEKSPRQKRNSPEGVNPSRLLKSRRVN